MNAEMITFIFDYHVLPFHFKKLCKLLKNNRNNKEIIFLPAKQKATDNKIITGTLNNHFNFFP